MSGAYGWGFVRRRRAHGRGDGYGWGNGDGIGYGDGDGRGYGDSDGAGYGYGTPEGYEVERTKKGLRLGCTEVRSVRGAEKLLAKWGFSVWLPFVIAELEEV